MQCSAPLLSDRTFLTLSVETVLAADAWNFLSFFFLFLLFFPQRGIFACLDTGSRSSDIMQLSVIRDEALQR